MTVKVLVVEDEPLLRMLAVDLVEEAGFEALEACDADQAIHVLETVDDVRILMTDIDMPGTMDGLKLAAATRHRWPPIQIIVVSGKQRPLPHEIPEDGAFFTKPYDVRTITDTLHRMSR